jgi:hypothetical protein
MATRLHPPTNDTEVYDPRDEHLCDVSPTANWEGLKRPAKNKCRERPTGMQPRRRSFVRWSRGVKRSRGQNGQTQNRAGWAGGEKSGGRVTQSTLSQNGDKVDPPTNATEVYDPRDDHLCDVSPTANWDGLKRPAKNKCRERPTGMQPRRRSFVRRSRGVKRSPESS